MCLLEEKKKGGGRNCNVVEESSGVCFFHCKSCSVDLFASVRACLQVGPGTGKLFQLPTPPV